MAERSKAPDSNSDDDDDANFGRECGQRATTTAATMETSGFVGSNPTSDKTFFPRKTNRVFLFHAIFLSSTLNFSNRR